MASVAWDTFVTICQSVISTANVILSIKRHGETKKAESIASQQRSDPSQDH